MELVYSNQILIPTCSHHQLQGRPRIVGCLAQKLVLYYVTEIKEITLWCQMSKTLTYSPNKVPGIYVQTIWVLMGTH